MSDTWKCFIVLILSCFDADNFLDARVKSETDFDVLSRNDLLKPQLWDLR